MALNLAGAVSSARASMGFSPVQTSSSTKLGAATKAAAAPAPSASPAAAPPAAAPFMTFDQFWNEAATAAALDQKSAEYYGKITQEYLNNLGSQEPTRYMELTKANGQVVRLAPIPGSSQTWEQIFDYAKANYERDKRENPKSTMTSLHGVVVIADRVAGGKDKQYEPTGPNQTWEQVFKQMEADLEVEQTKWENTTYLGRANKVWEEAVQEQDIGVEEAKKKAERAAHFIEMQTEQHQKWLGQEEKRMHLL